LKEIIKTVEEVESGDIQKIMKSLKAKEPVERYWGATACTMVGEKASPVGDLLKNLLKDPEAAVRIAAAEALYHLGEKEIVLQTLTDALRQGNLMARVQALNVLETMDDDATPALDAVKTLVPEDPQDRDYDSRAAERLVEKLGGN
jgi:HEAT repeat protein